MVRVKKIFYYIIFALAIHTFSLFNITYGMECSICLENISEQHKKTTSCKHTFHKDCLDQWFVTSAHKDCPMCRKKLSAAPSQLEQKRAQEQLKQKRDTEIEQANYARRVQEEEYQRDFQMTHATHSLINFLNILRFAQFQNQQLYNPRSQNNPTNSQRRQPRVIIVGSRSPNNNSRTRPNSNYRQTNTARKKAQNRPQPKKQTPPRNQNIPVKRSQPNIKTNTRPQKNKVIRATPDTKTQNKNYTQPKTRSQGTQNQSGVETRRFFGTIIAKGFMYALTTGIAAYILNRNIPRWVPASMNTSPIQLYSLMVAPLAFYATRSNLLVERSQLFLGWLGSKLRII